MTIQHRVTDAPTFTSDTMLSIREISDLLNRDRKTISIWIRACRYPNAVKEEGGREAWSVPVRDLVKAGDLDPSAVVEVAAILESSRESKQVRELRARVAELESAVAVATAVADERLGVINTLQSVITAVTSTAVTR